MFNPDLERLLLLKGIESVLNTNDLHLDKENQNQFDSLKSKLESQLEDGKKWKIIEIEVPAISVFEIQNLESQIKDDRVNLDLRAQEVLRLLDKNKQYKEELDKIRYKEELFKILDPITPELRAKLDAKKKLFSENKS